MALRLGIEGKKGGHGLDVVTAHDGFLYTSCRTKPPRFRHRDQNGGPHDRPHKLRLRLAFALIVWLRTSLVSVTISGT